MQEKSVWHEASCVSVLIDLDFTFCVAALEAYYCLYVDVWIIFRASVILSLCTSFFCTHMGKDLEKAEWSLWQFEQFRFFFLT